MAFTASLLTGTTQSRRTHGAVGEHQQRFTFDHRAHAQRGGTAHCSCEGVRSTEGPAGSAGVRAQSSACSTEAKVGDADSQNAFSCHPEQ